MSTNFRSVGSVLVSIVVLGILTVAHASASTDKNTKNEEHHGHLSKAAFWKHHKHHDKTAKPSPSMRPKAQTEKVQPKTAQLKPVSAKTSTATKEKNQAHAKASKPSTGKSVAVAKTNASKKPKNGQTSSFKQ